MQWILSYFLFHYCVLPTKLFRQKTSRFFPPNCVTFACLKHRLNQRYRGTEGGWFFFPLWSSINHDFRCAPILFGKQRLCFSRLQSHSALVNCVVFWWSDYHTLLTWGLCFATCLVHQVLATADGVDTETINFCLFDKKINQLYFKESNNKRFSCTRSPKGPVRSFEKKKEQHQGFPKLSRFPDLPVHNGLRLVRTANTKFVPLNDLVERLYWTLSDKIGNFFILS